MRKIHTLFIRDKSNPRLVSSEVDPECAWVLDGEGVATAKWDGSACLIHRGAFYRRHQLKTGRQKPLNWLHWDFDPEAETGHGWIPVSDAPSDCYHREAMANSGPLLDGTYELCGPKVQGNPHNLDDHVLVRHGLLEFVNAPHDRVGIVEMLRNLRHEGIVWHHPDGRMAKLKRRDFGFPWPVQGGEW